MRVRVLRACAFAAALLAGCASVEPVRRGGTGSPADPTPEFGAAAGGVGGGRGTPTTPDAATPDLAADPALALLLRTALERSPAILSERERAVAATESGTLRSALPNPELLVGWYAESVETRVGPQQGSLGIRQRIPFPAKLATQADLGALDARRAALVYERRVRDVLVDVVRTAHEIAYLDEATGISGRIGTLLERYVAAAGAESGSPLSELFRAETQRAQLDNDRVVLAELRVAEAQHLRALLDLAPGAVVGTPRIPAQPDVDVSFEQLLQVAERHSQELAESGLDVDAAALHSELARLRRAPDLSLGVTRVFTDRVPSSLGMRPPDDGKDPVLVQGSVSLPIWFQQDEAALRQAAALERAAGLARIETAQRLRDRVARAWYRLGNARRLVLLYDDVLVPRAAAAARTADDLLASGQGTLGGTLETIAVLHNFRLAAARARADRGQALADLEAVLGTPLVRAGP